MYLLLLGFGVGLSAAGVLLAAAGLSIREGSFDSGLFTPGIVAAVGGFLLIGLGLALRTLQRIERALAARSVLRVAQEQITELIEASDQCSEPDPFAIALQASSASHPAAAVARTRDDPSANGAAEKSPDTARLPKAAVPAAVEANSETDTEHFGRPGNGAATGRISLRLPTNARPGTPAERPKTPAFDSMWPKAPRPIRSTQPAPSQAAGAPPAIERQQNTEQGPDMATSTAVKQTIAQEAAAQNMAPQAVAAQSADAQGQGAQGADAYNEPVPISVLRSGIVDGMAYTLYSDGSIEAQLPRGILRFGSITELRHHLEQGA